MSNENETESPTNEKQTESSSTPVESQQPTQQLNEELSSLGQLAQGLGIRQDQVEALIASGHLKPMTAGLGIVSAQSQLAPAAPLMLPPKMIEGFSDLLESWVDSSERGFDVSGASYEELAHLERVATGLALVANRFHGTVVELFFEKRQEGYRRQRY